ncbi:hypothetical protein ACHAXM_005056 [Skeletonema potamos]
MSYNYYMRPQDRDGNNHGAVSRGRSQHQHQVSSSRGRNLDRSDDFRDMRSRHHYHERDMSINKRRSDHYHGSKSSDDQRYASSYRSRSSGPSRYNSSSSRDHSYQHNSSNSRKQSRSPDTHHRNPQSSDSYDRSRHPRSFGGGASKHASYDHYPLASTNLAQMYQAPSLNRSNEFQRQNNAESYYNASYVGGGMSNMNTHQSYYHQPKHCHDPKRTSCERRPLASRQDFSSITRPGQQQSSGLTAPRFSTHHTIHELIQIAHSNLTAMNPSATAAFWNKVLKQMSGRNTPNQRLPNYHEELGRNFNQIFEHTERTLRSFNTKELTQTIYSMSKLADVLRKRGGTRYDEDIDESLSGLLLNGDMTPNKDLFRAVACESRDKLHLFDARGVSNLAYAYALVGYVPQFDDGSDLFDHIATQAAKRRAEFNSQGMSNMVWAFARANKPHPAFYAAMGDQVVAFKHLEEFKPQALANTVWAYATSGINHPNLFRIVANHIVGLDSLDKFDPQELSNTMWAYAKADRFIPQHLSNTLWAYATAGIHHPTLFNKMANHIVASGSLHKFDPQELKDIVWAYATAQVSHPKLFHKVTKAAIKSKEDFVSQGIANLLWAYATMGIIDKQLFSSFALTAAKLIDTYTNQDLANIAWAYAVADVDAPTLFNDDFINKCVEEEDGFENEALCQLHQWHLWQTKEKSNAGLPKELQVRCCNVFIDRDPTHSKLQVDVKSQLTSIGLEPKEEVLMDSGYRIDVIVKVNGKTTGIEVDGPSHFIGRGRSPLARIILKRRQVSSIDGVELVSVPYWEWDELIGREQVKKQEYLRELLSG